MSQPKVTGVGGIFFKSQNPKKINAWYSKHLGIKTNEYGATFEFRNSERPEEINYLQLSPFKESTKYFEPSKKEFMINFRVEDLEGLLDQLKKEGIIQIGEMIREPYGLFAHIMDPEGNKIELWEPFHKEYEKVVDSETNS